MKVRFLLIIFSVITFSSCKKFLTTTPGDSMAPENYYKTEEDLENALAGIYDRLGDLQLYGQGLFSNLCFSDDFFFYNYRTGIQVNDINASTSTVYGLWERCYAGIDRANALLENIDQAVAVKQAAREVIKAQALFLRAYYYFLLVENFGGVPLKLTATQSPSETLLPRSGIKDVYDVVVRDIKSSIEYLRPISDYGFNGRISKTAAQGILARVYLTMAGSPLKDITKFEQARAMADSVISSGLHSLAPSYSQIFINHSQDIYDIKEGLWEVEFAGNRTTAFPEEGTLGAYLGIPSSDDEIGHASPYIHVLKKLYDTYDSLDLRRDWSIADFKYVASTVNGAPVTVKEKYNASQIYNRSPGKWRREYEILKPKNASYTPTNFPLLRYADILLMYAEADNEIAGPQPRAIDYVNQVRKRGWGKLSHGEIIKRITVTSSGTGYTTVPKVTITGGGGEGAEATAVISGGRVTSVIITSRGSSYKTDPTVTISGGNGTGATAVALITTEDDAALSATHTASKESFRSEIRDERYREFSFEGMRKHDLLRWGIYTETMRDLATDINNSAPNDYKYAATAATYTSQNKFVFFPIPSLEISVNKKVIQNEGW